MAPQQRQWTCRECGCKTLHARETFPEGMGCLLTVLTGGLFLPLWCLLRIRDAVKPYRCQVCGRGS